MKRNEPINFDDPIETWEGPLGRMKKKSRNPKEGRSKTQSTVPSAINQRSSSALRGLNSVSVQDSNLITPLRGPNMTKPIDSTVKRFKLSGLEPHKLDIDTPSKGSISETKSQAIPLNHFPNKPNNEVAEAANSVPADGTGSSKKENSRLMNESKQFTDGKDLTKYMAQRSSTPQKEKALPEFPAPVPVGTEYFTSSIQGLWSPQKTFDHWSFFHDPPKAETPTRLTDEEEEGFIMADEKLDNYFAAANVNITIQTQRVFEETNGMAQKVMDGPDASTAAHGLGIHRTTVRFGQNTVIPSSGVSAAESDLSQVDSTGTSNKEDDKEKGKLMSASPLVPLVPTIFRLAVPPPSVADLLTSWPSFGLPEKVYKDPHYSDAKDYQNRSRTFSKREYKIPFDGDINLIEPFQTQRIRTDYDNTQKESDPLGLQLDDLKVLRSGGLQKRCNCFRFHLTFDLLLLVDHPRSLNFGHWLLCLRHTRKYEPG
jgi:hypothetical protein